MDKLAVQEWWKSADQVDFVVLQERLPPQRTMDSGSITLEVPGKGTIKTGLEAEYDLSEPFLKSTQELMDLAQDAATP